MSYVTVLASFRIMKIIEIIIVHAMCDRERGSAKFLLVPCQFPRSLPSSRAKFLIRSHDKLVDRRRGVRASLDITLKLIIINF